MSSIQNYLMDFFLWLKIMVFGTKFLIEEMLCKIPPLDGTQNNIICLALRTVIFYLKLNLDAIKREGEYAVITGGNRGIGWHTVKGLVKAGMKVIVGKLLVHIQI